MWKRFRHWLLGTQHQWDLWELQTIVVHGMAAAFGGVVQSRQQRRCVRCGLYQQRSLEVYDLDEACADSGEPCEAAAEMSNRSEFSTGPRYTGSGSA